MTKDYPECSVDSMQWCILYIKNEENLKNSSTSGVSSTKETSGSTSQNAKSGWTKRLGLKLFNDSTYTKSYNSELDFSPVEKLDLATSSLVSLFK